MGSYDVVMRSVDGAPVDCRLHVPAGSPGEAVWRASRQMRSSSTSPLRVYAVYRHRRVRGRRLVGLFAGGGGGNAGVREPRRPLPDLPSDTIRRRFPLALSVGAFSSDRPTSDSRGWRCRKEVRDDRAHRNCASVPGRPSAS